jgi:1,4-dihydroxy-2-naphthoyl-CoA hydrolase
MPPAEAAYSRGMVTNSTPSSASKSIWLQPVSVDVLTRISLNTAVSHLGIEFLEVGDDFLKARVPVDPRTHQPYGLLHGGVSVVLAETLGSCGAAYSCPPGHQAVGLDINANHLRGVKSGWVTGVARPVHRGRTTHVWQIDLTDDTGALSCVSRITMAILAPRAV